jgi:hypothetical protein|tara:strand:- start:670 stop:1206 length:537 start_codon:yes stop_codon:yes gene_type:complete
MNSYKNFLPDLFFNKLNDIVTSNNFQWYFQEKTVRNKLLEGDDNFMFTHMLCDTKFDINSERDLETEEKSNWFPFFEPIKYFIDSKFKVKKLLRMKLNLYTNQHKKINHQPHVDYPFKNQGIKTAVFNFTTCDGGTNVSDIFYKSVSNKIIIFNRENKHFGIVQTNTPRRIVLNINWK